MGPTKCLNRCQVISGRVSWEKADHLTIKTEFRNGLTPQSRPLSFITSFQRKHDLHLQYCLIGKNLTDVVVPRFVQRSSQDE